MIEEQRAVAVDGEIVFRQLDVAGQEENSRGEADGVARNGLLHRFEDSGGVIGLAVADGPEPGNIKDRRRNGDSQKQTEQNCGFHNTISFRDSSFIL